MIGTEKQITWAEEIINDAINGNTVSKGLTFTREQQLKNGKNVEEIDAAITALAKLDDAVYVINHRVEISGMPRMITRMIRFGSEFMDELLKR